MDVWELMLRVKETAQDYGMVWPTTYNLLEEDLERHFAAFAQEVADEAAERAYDNGFDDGYDSGYDAGYVAGTRYDD